MKQDITLYLAIEQLVQEKMVFHKGMPVASDHDLAELFDVDLRRFRNKVKQNKERFPSNFMVKFSDGGYAFSETGIMMLGGLFKSERAIKVHLQFIEYFVHLVKESGFSIFDLIDNSKYEL